MSELTNTHYRKLVHCRLLATVSAAALLRLVSAGDAQAADTGKPALWLDLGGQLDQLSDEQSRWVPDYFTRHAGPLGGTFRGVQKVPRYGFDADAGLTIRPDGEGWVLAASVRLGRAQQSRDASKQAHILPYPVYVQYPSAYSVVSHETESHLFVDFSVGKDVGLGIAGGESTLSAGVRIANMRSRSDVQINSNFPISYHGSATNEPDSHILRKFRGAGPVVAWKASAPIAGNLDAGELGIDWGLNGGLIFGRQTMSQTVDAYYRYGKRVHYAHPSVHRTAHSTRWRQKRAAVPEAGAYAAIYYRFPSAKLSLGYRGDWYFNALDGGVASTRQVDRGFFGPFAKISIGIPPSGN
jgi:hypothetical protein